MASMTEDEEAIKRKRDAEYQKEYRRANPDKVAQWAINGAMRILKRKEGAEQ